MIAGLYLAVLLLTSLPAFQRWGAGQASRLLTDKTGGRVSIGNMRLNVLGHIILDNVELYDQRDTLMLQASRIAAKMDLMPLVEKKIRISGAQLIGARATLCKDGEAPYNFQFLVDAFSSKDTTSSPLDLQLGALVVRRGEVRFDRLDQPTTPGKFNPNHLHVKDLSLTARLLVQMPDTMAIDLRGLSFREESGLNLQRLSFDAEAGKSGASIRKLVLELPETEGTITIQNSRFNIKSPLEGEWEGDISGSVCPRDLSCFVPQLQHFDDIIKVSSEVRWTGDKGQGTRDERQETRDEGQETRDKGQETRDEGQASIVDGQLKMEGLSIGDKGGDFSLLCDATVSDIKDGPTVVADIKKLSTGTDIQQFLTQNLRGEAKEISPILTRLGATKTKGTATYQDGDLRTNLTTESEQGTVEVEATLLDMKEVEGHIVATDIRIGHLMNLSEKTRGTTEEEKTRGTAAREAVASFEARVEGTLPGKAREASINGTLPKTGGLARLAVEGLLNHITYKGYEHRNIPFSADIDGETISGGFALEEPNTMARVQVQTSKQGGSRSLQCQANLRGFGAIPIGSEGHTWDITGNIDADFSDIDLGNLQGKMHVTGLELSTEEDETLRIGDVAFSNEATEGGQHLLLESDFLSVRADGSFNWKTLPASLMLPFRQNLPSLFPVGSKYPQPSGNDFRFFVQVQDTLLAERLLGTDLRLPEKSIIEGTISDALGQMALQMHIPQLEMGSQQLQSIECRAEAGQSTVLASLQGQRIMKDKPVELNVDAYAKDDKVTTRLHWDNKGTVTHTGEIGMTGQIRRDHASQTVIDAKMNASHIIIGDTLWNIMPASIRYHDKVIDVADLSIRQADRHINIGGRISALDTDTLGVELADIDISYIMDLINFHKVDFDGRATGSIYATSLMKKPLADAFLQVKNFTFNAAAMGDMDLHANWGKQERAITLEADMRGPVPQHRTLVQGTIIPGKGQEDGLNLNVRTSHIDLAFLHKYTKSIFRETQGRASGWTRIYGPFKTVNLEGDMFINEMRMHVTSLGADYRLAGDSVILRADNIWLRGARLYDNLGAPGMSEHTATIDGHLMHDALKNLRYDVSIDGHNLLCYNFPQQGSMNFFGTVYADAKAHMTGNMSSVNIDVDATPMPGTTIIYNVATPGMVNDAEFITYVQPSSVTKEEVTGTAAKGGGGEETEEDASPSSTDIRINFNIDANPNAQIRLLMDPTTGDNIALHGVGRLHANYYNKGRFQLFGTYRTTDGNYRMSIRDLIRKDFTFRPDGTIVFGGDAMQAALNLTATHTVPNVSLDDLSSSGLGLSNTRVDCIMNIGGSAREPVISFDFDLPNANADEKQMVRSMLSSEEERDLQAIYLLGVGRFYTYGTLADTKQTKGSMAMNSVLSSVLSSRFNQIMSQALGGSNWSFGTNLRTGEEGWEHLDVEGMLSGKMLSGRLQFSGNFGYRENKYKMGGNNFIGDFDIQYRLSPRSPFSLKAYNQTNDRYFTQSSLTTQGIGIKFQRDFNRFMELFRRTRKK